MALSLTGKSVYGAIFFEGRMMWAMIGIATVAIHAFGAGCCTRKWIAEHEDARPIKLGAVMAKEPKCYITFLISGSSPGFAFDAIEEAQKWASDTSVKFLQLKIRKKCRWNSVASYLRNRPNLYSPIT